MLRFELTLSLGNQLSLLRLDTKVGQFTGLFDVDALREVDILATRSVVRL